MRFKTFDQPREYHNDVERRVRILRYNDINLEGAHISKLNASAELLILKQLVASHMSKFDIPSDQISEVCVRPLSPGFDFVDGHDRNITSQTWVQPAPHKVNFEYFENFDLDDKELFNSNSNGLSNAYTVYKTHIKAPNIKSIVIHGFTLSIVNNVEEIQLWRHDTKLLERVLIPYQVDHNKRIRIFLRQPLIVHSNSIEGQYEGQLEIKMVFSNPTSIKREMVEILGFTAEQVGEGYETQVHLKKLAEKRKSGY